MFANIRVSPFKPDMSVFIRCEGMIDTFFFSPFLFIFGFFKLSFFRLLSSSALYIDPLLECTISTNAAMINIPEFIFEIYNQYAWHQKQCALLWDIQIEMRVLIQQKLLKAQKELHCTSRHSCHGLSYLTRWMRGNLKQYGAANTFNILEAIVKKQLESKSVIG